MRIHRPLTARRIFLYAFTLLIFSFFFFAQPSKVDTANLTSASATMSNSRFSFRAGIGATATSGTSDVVISTSNAATIADYNTNHLFPNDSVCFWAGSGSNCVGSTLYTVANTLGAGATAFVVSPSLGSTMVGGTYALGNQTSYITISFTTTNVIPNGGSIVVNVPAANQSTALNSDGMANTASTIANNGFDLASVNSSGVGVTMTSSDVAISGGGGTWGTPALSIGTGTTTSPHTITINRTSGTVAAGTTITLTVGSTAASGAKLTNPAPVNPTGSHTQGTADAYTITVKTRDGSAVTIDTVDMKVAPIESVLVSANVDTSLSFSLAGRGLGTTACNVASNIATTGTAVDWGTLATADSFSNASQLVTVSTNASSGYAVTVEENDQMGKNGIACVGSTAGESVSCIKDTTCDGGTCTQSLAVGWTAATNNGLGYSLENVSGSHNSFSYNTGSAFLAKQFADQEAAETKQSLLSHTGPVSGDSAYVCYRISISNTQPAGYYYNKVKYTATPIF